MGSRSFKGFNIREAMSDLDMIRAFGDIVICSYMPDDGKLATQRLAFLIAQVAVLREQFPNAKILVYGSNWTEVGKRVFFEKTEKFHISSLFKKRRYYKAEIHNRVMKAIRNRGTGLQTQRAVLILGDDVVPTEMDGIGLDPVDMLSHWIEYPYEMPAPCLFFSCKGTLRDTYYKERMKKGVRFSPTAAVTDWAILIRSDFQVHMNKEEISGFVSEGHEASDDPPFQYNSDAMLRFKAASLGYEVLKDQELFFETFQSTSSDKNSVWYQSREARRNGVKWTNEFIRQRWPWLFLSESNTPIWQARGSTLKQLVHSKKLKKTEYGYVPNPKVLVDSYYKHKRKNSLEDLL